MQKKSSLLPLGIQNGPRGPNALMVKSTNYGYIKRNG